MAGDDYYDEEEEAPVPPRPAGEGVRILGAQEAAAREAELSAGRLPEDSPRFGDVPPPPSGPRASVSFPLREGGGATTAPDLPHWTEPPTGEVPRVLMSDDEEDDLEAWAGLRNRGPRWRDEERADWEQPDFEDEALLADDSMRVGALDDQRPDPVDMFEFDEPEEELAPVATRRTQRPPTRISTYDPGFDGGGPGGGRNNGGQPTNDRDIAVAVGTGVAVGVIALICFRAGPGPAAALATLVVLLAAVELFDVFRRAGFRPATLLGLVATGALMISAYTRGERAIPLILALSVIFSMLWYLLGVVKTRPTHNLGVTLLGIMWVGFLGSFASLMLRYPEREGVAFLLGTILAVVANDVGALFAGRQFGNTPLAGDISPNKTLEGFLGGLVISLAVAAIVISRIHPWDLGSAIVLAIVVSLIGPAGDLAQSMVKRDLGMKDMGTILPGHGGFMDRFDGVLFSLPAAYYLVELLGLPTT